MAEGDIRDELTKFYNQRYQEPLFWYATRVVHCFFLHYNIRQGPTNTRPGRPGQVKKYAEQVFYLLGK